MELEALRKEIEKLNEEIIVLLGKRKALTLKVAKVKKENNLPIYDPSRESEQSKKIAEIAKKNQLDPKEIVELFDCFVAYCRKEMENHWESLP